MSSGLRSEFEQDRQNIWNVNRAAFDSDAEPDLVDALRAGGFVEISIVAEIDNAIVGHILFSRLAIVTDAGIVDTLSLAPMAILPDHQGKGIGSKLVTAGLELCRQQGHRIVVVLGHPRILSAFRILCRTCRAFRVAVWWRRGLDGNGAGSRCARRCFGNGPVPATVRQVRVTAGPRIRVIQRSFPKWPGN